MEAKKYGREADEETQGIDRPPNALAEAQKTNVTSSANASGADEETSIDYSQQLETSRYNVQVRIGPNGETIIDEESLVVDRAENEDTSNYTHVVESDHTKFVNSGTYGKRYRGSRWSAEETELFYNVRKVVSTLVI
jgi:transcription factor TFIIIB component B''